MKVKIDKFCSIAPSSAWQAWLYNFDVVLYNKFFERFKISKGCGQTRELMVEILRDIESAGGGDKLLDFLRANCRYALVDDEQPVAFVGSSSDFAGFNSRLLTFPHRMVFDGDDVESVVREFVADKLKFDYVIVGSRAYVEFLRHDEVNLLDSIPSQSWITTNYKLSKG